MGKRRSDKKPRLEYVVCKPCWELKYCPYGPLVEYFPLHPEGMTRTQAMLMHRKSRAELKKARREVDVFEAVRYFLFSDPANWEWILQFDTTELECNVFGHVFQCSTSPRGSPKPRISAARGGASRATSCCG